MQKSLVAAMALTFLSLPVFATDSGHFSCHGTVQPGFSLDLKIGESSAFANILSVQDELPYTPPVGPLQLTERIELARGWIGYQGISAKKQIVRIKFNSRDLEVNLPFKAMMVVAPSQSSTYEVGLGLLCEPL